MANNPELTGFTLFKVTRGWQMSLRPVGEEGWIIRIISDEDASRILSTVGNDPTPTSIIATTATRQPARGVLDLRPTRRRVLLD